MTGLNLNGSTALAESIKHQLANVRRDWRVEAANMQARLDRGLLELERTVSAAREIIASVQDGAPGRDGAPGQPGQPGADGARGERGEPGTFTTPLPFKPGQITYSGQLIYHEGSTFAALRDTAQTPPHADFQPVAYRGRDAYAGRVRGVYDPACKDYRALDLVTHNDGEWRCVKDNPGSLPGDDWLLTAKRGKPGIKGPQGDRGERGPPGLGLAHVELIDTALVFTRTDGSAITVDLAALIG